MIFTLACADFVLDNENNFILIYYLILKIKRNS